MDALQKELQSRYNEIKKEIKAIYEANLHITEWDVPEVDEAQAKKMLLDLMHKACDEIYKEVLHL
jgi:2'-5' RNA ligase